MKAETVKKRIEATLSGYFTKDKLHSVNAYERRLLDLLTAANQAVDYVIREQQMRADNAKKQEQARSEKFPGDLPKVEDNIKTPKLDD